MKNKAGNAKQKQMEIIVLPITFPIAILGNPFTAAPHEATVSSKSTPIKKNAKITFETFQISPRSSTASKTKSAAKNITVKQTKITIHNFKK